MDWVTAWRLAFLEFIAVYENSLTHNLRKFILTRAGWEGVTNCENKWLLQLGMIHLLWGFTKVVFSVGIQQESNNQHSNSCMWKSKIHLIVRKITTLLYISEIARYYESCAALGNIELVDNMWFDIPKRRITWQNDLLKKHYQKHPSVLISLSCNISMVPMRLDWKYKLVTR